MVDLAAAGEPWASSLATGFQYGDGAPDRAKWEASARQPFRVIGDWESVLASSEIEVISSGYIWTEGPVWVPKEQALYYTDVPAACIYRWTAETGAKLHVRDGGGWDGSNVDDIEIRAEPGSNGMALDPDGEHVYICQHPLRRIIRVKLGAITPGTRMCDNEQHYTVVADKTPDGKVFNSPNDVCVGPDGAVWFTDPPYGMLEKARFCDEFTAGRSYLDEKASVCAGIKGVYRVPPGGGEVELATGFHERPNGLAFSNDWMTMWVADSSLRNPTWTGYPVNEDQSLGKATKVLCQATLGEALGVNPQRPKLGDEGLADGFRCDTDGRIWSSMPDGICVLDPNTMKVVCQVIMGVNTANLVFGDGGDVFICGAGHVWRLQRKVSAAGASM